MIRREQVGTVPAFFSVRVNKFAKYKIGLRLIDNGTCEIKNKY